LRKGNEEMIPYKSSAMALIVIMVILHMGCSNPSGEIEGDISLYLHIQAYYEGNVRVSINNEVVFNEIVSTNPRLGLAFYKDTEEPAIRELKVSPGENRIRVWYNNSILPDTSVTIHNTTYLGIGWSDTNQGVIYRIQSEPFLYE
jgi:hypothetical protein